MKKFRIKLSIQLVLILISTFILFFALLWGTVYILIWAELIAVEDVIRATNIITLIAFTITLSIFGLLINRIFFRRIKLINKAMESVTKGNYEAQLKIKGNDEITDLLENFNRMTIELNSNEYLNKEFTRNFSHEYKMPISIIHGYAELICTESKDDSIKESAEIIIGQAKNLNTLSTQILDIAYIDSMVKVETAEVFSPAAQIRKILQDTQLLWENKSIELELEFADFTIVSNEKLLNLVWLNLIGNAIKYNKTGGRINITLKHTESNYTFIIKDTGIGISEDNLDKIFILFYRADKSRKSEGLGLGLPLVKKIIDKLNGTISVESVLGSGSAFTLVFPAVFSK